MSERIERTVVISGLGLSRMGRRSGIPVDELTVESSTRAIADAGLTLADIDGIASLGETLPGTAANLLGISPRWVGGEMGYYGLLTPVVNAVEAIAAGRARHVLVYRSVNMFGGSIVPSDDGPRMAVAKNNPMLDMSRLLVMHAYAAPNWVAMHARRHMHLYGTTREQFGWLAVNSRRNAALNPDAAYQTPFSIDDYLAARMVSDPICLLDCDVPIDGSIAYVISAADHAGDCDHPVRIEAMGGTDGPGGWDQRPDYPMMASVEAAAEMWARTDLKPADVDVAELYDGFTYLTFTWLEAMGFCPIGGAGPFVEGATRIALDGELPLNTYGGQLSAGRMHGYWVMHEAVLQLRGQAGARQVAGAEVAAVANGGGPIAGCFLLTR